MAQFYGTIDGQAKTQATRRGNKSSGLVTHAASWKGAIRVELNYDEYSGRETFHVSRVPWHGSGGPSKELAKGEF